MQAKATIPLQQDDDEDFYPSSDGRPMAESDLHLKEMFYLIQALRDRYQNVPDVYVAGNLLLYYVRGDRKACLAPDVFVVKGVPKRDRLSFLLWKEGQAPCFVIEVTSKSTRDEDIEKKRDRYERMGVEEYFLHDPLAEYLHPSLQGYRLKDGRYRKISPEPDGSLVSWTTGLRLRREGKHLHLVDLATGMPLPSFEEVQEVNRQQAAELLRQAEEIRRKDEEIARLRRELESR
ncbi:MAG TPA: Uma2 family endonuclease [Thermoanaerobaculia bacterium]|nr:Uma2 family endonuclease [Thermoanaerobaculia bacterium]